MVEWKEESGGRPDKRLSTGKPTTLVENYVLDMLKKGSIEPVSSGPIIRSQLFFCSKEGLDGAKDGSQPVGPESVHSVPEVHDRWF